MPSVTHASAPACQNRTDQETSSSTRPGPVSVCDICNREFSTFAGMRLHQQKAHKALYNASVETSRNNIKKARWDPEETRLMAIHEARLTRIGTRFMNQALAEKIPDRTIESIKGQRKTQAYRELVRSLLEAPDPATSQPPAPDPPPDPDEPAPSQPTPPADLPDWRADIIRNLAVLRTELEVEDHGQAWRTDIIIDTINILNHDDANDTSAYPRVKEALDRHAEAIRPTTRMRRPRRDSPRPPPATRKEKRKREYALIQQMYDKDQKRCADTILNGHWKYETLTSPPRVTIEAQEDYWGRLFTRQSPPDQRPINPARPPQWEMMRPITKEELKTVLGSMDSESAAGPEGISVRMLKSWPITSLTATLNLWLLTTSVPSVMKHARTTLIPKTPEAATADKFRPITVSSTVVRAFTKTMARRAARLCPLHPAQRAFIAADGAAENVTLLQCLIRDAHMALKPLAIAWLDMAKAFDSVSHQTITRAAERAGLPPPAVDLVADLYRDATTEVRRGAHIRTTRGVRQGDPWSPWLFNAVIDEAITPSIDEASPDDDIPPVLAFADDLVVLARTPQMLQHRITTITDHLAAAGLGVNAAKCCTSITRVDGRNKRRYADTNTIMSVNHEPLPNIGPTGETKYLGLKFTASGLVTDAGHKISEHLDQLKHAPLKPHQRMALLRTNVIPGALHALVLGVHRRASLRRWDQNIRAAVRAWLHLPKDTPSAFIHAHPTDGGLGVPELAVTVPLLRTDRLERLKASTLEPIRALTTRAAFRDLTNKARPTLRDGRAMLSKQAIRENHRRELLKTVDGAGLQQAPNHAASSQWVVAPRPPMPGSAFIGALKVRGGLHLTGQRAARTRGGGRVTCDAGCSRPETMGHISQTCPRTHDTRVARHDRVLTQVDGYLRDRGATTIREPTIRTRAGVRRPDLLVSTDTMAAVIDAQVVADNADLEVADQRKKDYYNTDEIRTDASTRLGTRHPIQFGSITLNWRGCWSRASVEILTKLGLKTPQLANISLRTIEGTNNIMRHFKRTTSRQTRTRPSRRTRTVTGVPP